MNYEKNYYDYIEYVRTLNRKRVRKSLRGVENPDYIQYEAHHIVPRTCGGPDSKDNLVLLTPREHFLAHYLLCKIYASGPNHHKMVYALNRMRTAHGTSSRLYEAYREEWLGLVSSKHKNKVVSEETRKRIGEKSRNRSAESNAKVGLGNRAYWKTIPETERLVRSRRVSESWNQKTEEEKAEINARRSQACLLSLQDPELRKKIRAGSLKGAWSKRRRVVETFLINAPEQTEFLIKRDDEITFCQREDLKRLVDENWQFSWPKFKCVIVRSNETKATKRVPVAEVLVYLRQGYELMTDLFSKPLPK